MHKHQNVMKDLKIAEGQLRAVINMIEEDRYCIDISKQILATIALLKKVNTSVLKNHIETCVKQAVESGKIEEKLEELELILNYMEKSF
ncbi:MULTISPECIES: metal-sensing transcriptional repressor [Pseudothermotoga]|jgi:DNA-binding FrmR family transcriptional regulator|uniref:Copper-sensing transcriptional repressor CsoR n=1 Tax=Pseudothermotoga lettingae (strain ATCC BAA-301 / DSM 14385 / NBRC 107922 / TMO) TaxID=416591 RepID=A8F768_PSELT|nr:MULTISPECIES: metal-sensing transcriptional repressor [Pseudothermotoga]ABV34002.1 protein of unknown function DUF156 [Pseudothermotoga lettingae TMO]GLI49059.1 transcriptional regulator [Pseudothermotoga lettingae TMO]HBJ81887.1 CsoR family transcriptional regulator [Pseudothermotoga sp.]HBT25094.1 CsoR family transcriptional regulator [Pseudothermotoga sp.]